MSSSRRAVLILFCGLPGSGKTTLAKQLEKQGRGVRICTDDWQEDLRVSHQDRDFHERLQKKLYRFSLELLSVGHDVILEDGLWTKAERDQKLADVTARAAAVEMHYFDLSLDELQRRLQSRNEELPYGAAHVGQEQLRTFWNIFERPGQAELEAFGAFKVYTDASPRPGSR